MASKPLGKLEFVPARNLRMLRGLQRIPTMTRLRDFEPWLEEKEGIIQVARITNGRHKGALHVYDGGTRVAYMVGLDGTPGADPDYPFRCWILDMAEQQAALAFLAHNKDAKKPGAFARYAVGIHAGEPESLAIKSALDSIPLGASLGRSLYGNDKTPGEFAAFAAAERIIRNRYAESGEWPETAAFLRWVLLLCRATYPQHGSPETAIAHDADLIQAVALIATWNPTVIGDETKEASLRRAINTWYGTSATGGSLFEPMQTMKPAHWRLWAAQRGKTSGGSESRGATMAKLIVTNHNRTDAGRLNKPH